MKRMIATFLLVVAPLAAVAARPNPADFPLKVHVVSSAQVWLAGGTSSEVLEVRVDGQPMQLMDAGMYWVLALGDYPARILPTEKSDHVKSYEVARFYQLLMPDGSVRKFQLTRLGPAAGGQ